MSEEKHMLILEIIALGYTVDSQTDYCVFIYYMGHTKHVDISIAKSADRYNDKILSTDFYTDNHHNEGEIGYYKAKRDHLKQILKNGEIDYGAMERTSTEIFDHYF